MKKLFSSITIILSLLIIGFAVWFILPFSQFGTMVLNDHLNPHFIAKSHVKEYVEETYGEKMEVKEITFTGKDRKDTMVVLLNEKQQEQEYTIYFGLKEDKVLFDEFQLKLQGSKYFSSDKHASHGGKNDRKKDLEETLKEKERIIWIFEKEMNKAEGRDLQKFKALETHIEKEYENLGVLLNSLDCLSLESRG